MFLNQLAGFIRLEQVVVWICVDHSRTSGLPRLGWRPSLKAITLRLEAIAISNSKSYVALSKLMSLETIAIRNHTQVNPGFHVQTTGFQGLLLLVEAGGG